MPDELQVETVEPTENQSTASVEKSEVTESEASPTTEKVKQPTEAEQATYALQKRIDRLTAQKTQEREARIAAEARASVLEGKAPEAKDLDPEYIREVGKAQAMGEVIYKQGVKSFGPEFDKSLAALAAEAPLIGKNGLFTPLMEAISDCDEPTKVIHHLGANPDIAEELSGLNARQVARRLVQIEADLAKTLKVSKAPEPINPIGTRGSGGEKSPDKMTDAEFAEWRRKQIRSRR